MHFGYCADRIVGCVLTADFILARILPFLVTLPFLSRSPGSCMVTLLDFVLCCCNFLLLVIFRAVCIGFDLCGPPLLGFLDGCTTSFHETILSSGLVSERTCLKTQFLGKLMENRSFLPSSMDTYSLHRSGPVAGSE